MREPDLQKFIDAIEVAFRDRLQPGTPLAALADDVFGAMATRAGEVPSNSEPEVLPVCRYLAPALVKAATFSPQIAAVAETFSHLSPRLQWRRRVPQPGDGSSFSENHANATVIGVDGLEERSDVRIGASLVAPGTVYPDHTHPPEEIYLVLSPGEWRNANTRWHEPGIGGLVHNPPGIVHAMRSAAAPLFAIWCLWSV